MQLDVSKMELRTKRTLELEIRKAEGELRKRNAQLGEVRRTAPEEFLRRIDLQPSKALDRPLILLLRRHLPQPRDAVDKVGDESRIRMLPSLAQRPVDRLVSGRRVQPQGSYSRTL